MMKPFEHNPPKNESQIRSSLESIHQTAKINPRSGPLSQGVGTDFPITIGSFHDRELACDFQQELNQAGIFSKLVSARLETRVLVDDEDRHLANELFQKHRRNHPNRRPRGFSRRYDFLIFGLGIALTVSFILVARKWDHPLALTIPLTFGAVGASLGHVADQIRLRYRQTGRLRVGIRDFLVLATIPGMIALAAKLLPQILFD
jgi:hypothetical protein